MDKSLIVRRGAFPWTWKILEKIPGVMIWICLILPIILSIYRPFWAATFVILFMINWFIKAIKMSYYLITAFLKTRRAMQLPWPQLMRYYDNDLGALRQRLSELAGKKRSKVEELEYVELSKLQRKIPRLQAIGEYVTWDQIYQVIILITYKESFTVLDESIASYARCPYPLDKKIFVLAGEEGDRANFLQVAEQLKTKYAEAFGEFIITVHPKGVVGESPGKGSNVNYAARRVADWARAKRIPFENVMVSNFDADTQTHPLYLAELTYRYLYKRQRAMHGYQPTHMYHNNVWDVPIMVRLVALTCTFLRMAESEQPEKFKSFSSRSSSLKMLDDVNYWDPAVIPEDSRQYWTAVLVYDGAHQVVPLNMPLYMDAVLSETYVETFRNQYRQLKRWAWGVTDFPFVVINLCRHPRLSWWVKFKHIISLMEGYLMWAVAPVIITFSGFIPSLINPGFRDNVAAVQLPLFMSKLLTISFVGVFFMSLISFVVIPRPKQGWKRLELVFQWLFMPVVSIFLSALPAIDAYTTLLRGKYMEYVVTEKARKP